MAEQEKARKPAKARRGRGEGGVRFREEKKLWEGTVSLGYDGQGKRQRRTVYGDSKREVLDEMARLRGQPMTPAEAARLTVAGLVARWLEGTKEQTSGRTYEDRAAVCAAHLTPHLGPVVASKLTALQVEEYYRKLRQAGVGKGSIRHAAKALRAALEHGVATSIVPGNVSRQIKLPPEPEREMVCLTPELMKHFLARACHLPLHPLLALALGSGMRRGELLGLHWPEVGLDGSQQPSVTVRQALTVTRAKGYELKVPKTRSARRTITLPPFAADPLRQLRQQREEAGLLRAPVFCTRGGGLLNFRNASRAFGAAVEWANDPEKGKRQRERTQPVPPPVIPEGLRFHDMRHTHASILLSAGASLKAVSARLGHANAALTLRIYAHCLPGDDERLAVMIAGVMG